MNKGTFLTMKALQYLMASIVLLLLALTSQLAAGAEGDRDKEHTDSNRRTVVLQGSNADHAAQIKRVLGKELPDDHTLKLVYIKVTRGTPSLGLVEVLQMATSLNAHGERDGIEIQRDSSFMAYLTRITPFVEGKRHGTERLYARGGHVRATVEWVDGVRHGLRRSLMADGSVQTELMFENGIPVGQSKSYNAEGKVIEVTDYENGKKHGKRTQYWPDNPDVVRRAIPYVDGEVHGLAREYHDNGQLSKEMPFKNGLLHGKERHFDEEGKPIRTRYWLEGDVVPQGVFDKEFAPNDVADEDTKQDNED